MSERGSFVSEYIYCDECFKYIKERIDDAGAAWQHKHLTVVAIPQFEEYVDPMPFFPVVAGKMGGLCPEDQEWGFAEWVQSLETCHEVRFVLIMDSGGVKAEKFSDHIRVFTTESKG